MGFRPAMGEAAVGYDGVVQDASAWFAIEPGQDTDAIYTQFTGMPTIFSALSDAGPDAPSHPRQGISPVGNGPGYADRGRGPYSTSGKMVSGWISVRLGGLRRWGSADPGVVPAEPAAARRIDAPSELGYTRAQSCVSEALISPISRRYPGHAP
jgi:hypothetical protein